MPLCIEVKLQCIIYIMEIWPRSHFLICKESDDKIYRCNFIYSHFQFENIKNRLFLLRFGLIYFVMAVLTYNGSEQLSYGRFIRITSF